MVSFNDGSRGKESGNDQDAHRETAVSYRTNTHGVTLKAIIGLAHDLRALQRQAAREYTPVVDDILRTRSRDTRHIEHTLDGLLGFCGHESVLRMYKNLCRHYSNIDTAATAFYVSAYREQWEDDEQDATP
jgi:hypothetical protein